MKVFKNIFKLIIVVVSANQTINAMNTAMTQYAATSSYSMPSAMAATCYCPLSGNSSVATNVCMPCDFYENPGFDSSEFVDLSESTPDELDSIQSQVKELAQTRGLGQKTANLVILDQISKNSTLDSTLKFDLAEIGFKVEVPEFVGISSQNIEKLLRSAELNLDSEWRELLERSGINSNSIQDSLEKQILPENFVAELKVLATKLEVKFNEIAEFFEKEENQSVFAKSYNWIKSCLSKANCPQLDKEVLDLLAQAQKNGWHLMVRSTGKEDTKICPNAGGNKSIANVAPTKANIIRAIGQVIISYFFDIETGQPKSLMQRLKCKDETIFDTPFTPVLIQRMIGENLGLSASISTEVTPAVAIPTETIPAGVIPVGCVVYTQESEGSTPGVSSLQCSFGHPEGVVESSVGIDTCFVDEDKNYHCIIKVKPTRLVPECEQEKCKLVSKLNPANMTTSPALDENAIKALQIIAAKIQSAYNQPMDLELVYMPKTKTIYLVQARPISVITLKPEYIKSIEKLNTDNIVSGLTVCAADASLRFINNPTEIIIAVTLDDALKIFNDPNPENKSRDSAKCVIVQKNAESTSHAAAVFRGANLPILIAHDYSKIESWVKITPIFSQAKLVVDVQREIIVKIDQPEQLAITSGWFSHPLPNKLSVTEIAQADQTKEVPAENLMPETSIHDLIELIKESDAKTAKKALSTVIFRIQEQIDNKKVFIESNGYQKLPAQQALQLLENLKSYTLGLAQQIQPVLVLPARDIKRLYYINWLEALLFQKESKTIINSYSFDSVIQNYDNLVNFIEQKINPLVQAGTVSSQIFQNFKTLGTAYKGAAVSLIPELENNWIKFVDAIYQQSPEPIKELETLLTEINNFDILPTWINFAFAETFKENNSNAVAAFNKLNQEFIQSKEALEFIKTQKQILDSYDISKWQKPEAFQAQLKNLQALTAVFIGEQFTNLLSQSQTLLVKLATLEAMDKFVELFDQSIKQLKGSILYPKDKVALVTNFKTMLEKYFDVLNLWANKLPNDSLKFHGYWPLYAYLKQIQIILGKLPLTREQLDATPSFSVTNAALGSTTAFERNLPERLEDVFTLVHQNLLISIGTFTKFAIPKISKPDSFAQTELQLFDLDAWLVGIRLSSTELTCHYNLPLRNHSVVFELSYDIQTHQTFLAIKFVGERRNRWDIIKDFAELVSELFGDIKVKESKIGANEVIVTVQISSAIDLAALKRHLNFMSNIANGGGSEPLIKHVFAGLIKNSKTLHDFVRKGLVSDKYTSSLIFEVEQRLLKSQDLIDAEIYSEISKGATRYIRKSLFSSDESKIKTSLEFLIKFITEIEYVPMYDLAIEFATIDSCLSDEWSNRYHSTKILDILCKKGYKPAFEAFLKATIAQSQSDNPQIKKEALDSLQLLVTYEYEPAFEPALKAAIALSLSDEWSTRFNSIKILDNLCKKGDKFACEAFLKAAIAQSQSDNPEIKKDSVNSFYLLVTDEYEPAFEPAFKAGIELASTDSLSDKWIDRYRSTKILTILCEKGYKPAWEAFLKVTITQSQSDNPEIKKDSAGSFYLFVRYEYEPAFEPALKAAIDSISNSGLSSNFSGESILKLLVKKPELKQHIQAQIRKLIESPKLSASEKLELEKLL